MFVWLRTHSPEPPLLLGVELNHLFCWLRARYIAYGRIDQAVELLESGSGDPARVSFLKLVK